MENVKHYPFKLLGILFSGFLALLVILGSHYTKTANAQIPVPDVPCTDERSPEFNSLRPYQASPCNKSIETVIACGNDLIVQKEYELTPAGATSCTSNADGSRHCNFEFNDSSSIKISLPDAELPIVGNTQLVSNGVNASPAPFLDEAQKVNEYVSWYLNGITGRAEDGFLDPENADDLRKIVDFSGPIKKLLPKRVQQNIREETIRNAGETNHNQTVGCVNLLGGITPCYPKRIGVHEVRLSDWESRLPPKEENFGNFKDYWIAYKEWRGQSCINILGISLCIDNPLKPNYWGNLFTYVPFSSTEDRIGKVTVNDNPAPQPTSEGVSISDVTYTPGSTSENLIYVPHMEEVTRLTSILQSTFAAQGSDTFGGLAVDDRPFSTTTYCDLNNVRWNSGDDVFGEYKNTPITGNVNYKVSMSCDFGILDPTRYDECIAEGRDPEVCRDEAGGTKCNRKSNVALSVYTKTPKINELWYRTVFGDMSIFKRIFPQSLSGPAQTLDLPGVTTAKYESDAETTLAGDPENERPGDRAEIFIPHLGGVQEYFLKGIQKMLRPKDLGSFTGGPAPKNPDSVNCDKNAPEAGSIPGLLSKQILINEFSREFPGNFIDECYNDVVAKAGAAGYDPAFAMAIWIEESGASDYSQFPDVADFGCAVNTARSDFNAQISCFLGLKANYASSRFRDCRLGSGLTMNDFLLIFSEGSFGGACTPGDKCYRKFCTNPQFPARIRDFYSRVSGGRSLPATP